MYTDEQYLKFDSFLTSGLYYMSSVARESTGIILSDFKGNNAYDIVAFNIVENYALIRNKPVYLKMNFFRFLLFKLKNKTKAKLYLGKYNGKVILTPSKIIGTISENEKTNLKLVYNIYDAYYKKGQH